MVILTLVYDVAWLKTWVKHNIKFLRLIYITFDMQYFFIALKINGIDTLQKIVVELLLTYMLMRFFVVEVIYICGAFSLCAI